MQSLRVAPLHVETLRAVSEVDHDGGHAGEEALDERHVVGTRIAIPQVCGCHLHLALVERREGIVAAHVGTQAIEPRLGHVVRQDVEDDVLPADDDLVALVDLLLMRVGWRCAALRALDVVLHVRVRETKPSSNPVAAELARLGEVVHGVAPDMQDIGHILGCQGIIIAHGISQPIDTSRDESG